MNVLKENGILLGSVTSLFIMFLIYLFKNKKSVEEFGKIKTSDEKKIEETINKVFGKMTQKLGNTNLVPSLKQSGDLTSNIDERIGVVKWFNISSGKRDIDKFTSPSRFKHNFEYRLWNVYSVELVRACIPRGQYTIDTFNNKMDILVNDSTVKTIEVGTGFYDINGFILQLNQCFFLHGIDLKVSYNVKQYTVNIENKSSDTKYTILYESGGNIEDSNFNELGFHPVDIEIGPNKLVVSTRRVDLFGVTSVNIELKEVNYENNNNILSSILLKNEPLTVYENTHIMSKRHLRPLINLNNLTVEVTFSAPFKKKRLYNFNGLDFDFTIEVISVEKQMPFQAHLQKFH